jgi:hypothetical protein
MPAVVLQVARARLQCRRRSVACGSVTSSIDYTASSPLISASLVSHACCNLNLYSRWNSLGAVSASANFQSLIFLTSPFLNSLMKILARVKPKMCGCMSSGGKKVSSPKAKRAGSGTGTGYGGEGFFSKGTAGTAQATATAAAAQRQSNADAIMTRLLADIRACLVCLSHHFTDLFPVVPGARKCKKCSSIDFPRLLPLSCSFVRQRWAST